MTLAITRATPDSVQHWLALFQAYLDFYHVSQTDADCQHYLQQRLTQQQAVVWLAEENGTPVGFALMYPGFNSLTLAPCWLLHDLFVSPASRGSGASKALLQACQAHLRELGGDLMLQTAHDNHIAQKLYESNGFVLDRDFRVYYWQSQQA